jgi:hypothetical protein
MTDLEKFVLRLLRKYWRINLRSGAPIGLITHLKYQLDPVYEHLAPVLARLIASCLMSCSLRYLIARRGYGDL